MNPTYYDLTSGQQLLLYSQMFTIHKQINNIFTLMLLEKKLDFEVLKAAVEYAYDQNDAFRLRFIKVGGKIKQYFIPKEQPQIEVLDFSGKTQADMDKCFYKYASTPFKLINRPMSKVFLVHSWDGMDGIYFGVSHMILDSWGICVFLQFVMEVYEAMKSGSAMPKPLSPVEPLLQKDLAYKDSPQYQKDIEFWQSEFERLPAPLVSHINGPSILENYRKKKKDPSLTYAPLIGLRTSARHEVLYVSQENVEKIQRYCDENKISMQAAFMFGVRTALSKLNDRQANIGFTATFARRGTLQEKRSGGTRVHSSTFRNIMTEDVTFEKACQLIFGQQMAIYRHAEFDTIEIINMEAKVYNRKGFLTGWYPMIFTFQPVKLVVAGGTPIHTKWYCNGAFSSTYYLTIMDADGTGALRCYYEYQKHVVTAQRIREFHSLVEQAIMAGVENPSASIGEILDRLDISLPPLTELPVSGDQAARTPLHLPDEKVAADETSSRVS
jgi:hypothetical protein